MKKPEINVNDQENSTRVTYELGTIADLTHATNQVISLMKNLSDGYSFLELKNSTLLEAEQTDPNNDTTKLHFKLPKKIRNTENINNSAPRR